MIINIFVIPYSVLEVGVDCRYLCTKSHTKFCCLLWNSRLKLPQAISVIWFEESLCKYECGLILWALPWHKYTCHVDAFISLIDSSIRFQFVALQLPFCMLLSLRLDTHTLCRITGTFDLTPGSAWYVRLCVTTDHLNMTLHVLAD